MLLSLSWSSSCQIFSFKKEQKCGMTSPDSTKVEKKSLFNFLLLQSLIFSDIFNYRSMKTLKFNGKGGVVIDR
jgi:hypothetical protein